MCYVFIYLDRKDFFSLLDIWIVLLWSIVINITCISIFHIWSGGSSRQNLFLYQTSRIRFIIQTITMINLFAHGKQIDFHRLPLNILLFKTFCNPISFFQIHYKQKQYNFYMDLKLLRISIDWRIFPFLWSFFNNNHYFEPSFLWH